MLFPEYTQITVRILLNHSSGFPGSDYRNIEPAILLTIGYSTQVLEILKAQRLNSYPVI